MFTRILAAIKDEQQGQAVLDLVSSVATEGVSQVRVLHLRERELSGLSWYAREGSAQAGYVADAAVFEARMAGFAAGGGVRSAIVDRVAEAILDEARLFGADLIILGHPRRAEFVSRLFGSVTQRVVQRAICPVMIAGRTPRGKRQPIQPGASAPGRR
jgi:nucleotide-binding universal stress UspA family protein